MKKTAFVELPEESCFFLDFLESTGEYYLRIEGMDMRMVIPVGEPERLEAYFGGVVDEYFSYLSD